MVAGWCWRVVVMVGRIVVCVFSGGVFAGACVRGKPGRVRVGVFRFGWMSCWFEMACVGVCCVASLCCDVFVLLVCLTRGLFV